jgi:hypothetical protein
MAAVFPQVYSFPTENGGLMNIELMATVGDRRFGEADLQARNAARDVGLDLSAEISRYTVDVPTSDAPLLTDDYAPVDSLLASQVDLEYTPDRSENESGAPDGAVGRPVAAPRG